MKLYNTTDFFHIYFIDLDNGKRYDVPFLSRDWFKFMWKNRTKYRIRIVSVINP